MAYELSSVIGGQWVLDNPSGQSSAYDSLHTNTTRTMSRLSDHDFPRTAPKSTEAPDVEFLSRSQIVEWLQDYVAKFDLAPHIRLNTRVERMVPLGDGTATRGWAVQTQGSATNVEFTDVVIAAGNYWDPRSARIPGSFDGERIHAKFYRSPTNPVDVAGKHVIVIGPGSTGCEVAAEIAASGASSVRLSARSGANIAPKHVNGVPLTESMPYLHPLDELSPVWRAIPEGLRRQIYHRLVGAIVKRSRAKSPFSYEAVGLPDPPHPLAKRTSVSQAIFPQLASGALRGCGEIVELAGDEVVLPDGSRLPADIIIDATGYHMTFPFVSTDVLDTSGDDLSMYRRIMHPGRTDLFVVGIARPTGSFWTMAEAQSRWIAQHLSGQSTFPSAREIERHTADLMATAMLPGFYGAELRADAKRRGSHANDWRRHLIR